MESIRSQLEKELGSRLRPQAWGLLVQRDDVGKVVRGEKKLSELVDEIRLLERAFGPSIPVQGDQPRMLASKNNERPAEAESRQEVLSRLVAEDAAKDAEVQAFREDHRETLGNNLLPWSGVEDWIERHSEGARFGLTPAWWLYGVAVPIAYSGKLVKAGPPGRERKGKEPLVPLEISPEEVWAHAGLRWLTYGVPDDLYERKVMLRTPGGALDKLRQLGERLVDIYGWTHSQAAVFVLTGLPPEIIPFSAEAYMRRKFPALSRVRLEVDPRMSPREVADALRERWASAVRSRSRDLTEKHLNLAGFSIGRPEEETWAIRMEAWNRQQGQSHADWVYSSASNFGRDYQEARRRVLGE